MQTSNTEEMVTISRAEYEQLQQENAQLEAKLAAREQEQAQVITSLTLQNEWLLEQLKLSKKKLFGRSSEQAEQMVHLGSPSTIRCIFLSKGSTLSCLAFST